MAAKKTKIAGFYVHPWDGFVYNKGINMKSERRSRYVQRGKLAQDLCISFIIPFYYILGAQGFAQTSSNSVVQAESCEIDQTIKF
jgi:hypothetical protein